MSSVASNKTPRLVGAIGSLMHTRRGRTTDEGRALTQSQPRESFPTSGLQPLSQDTVQIPFAVGDVIAGKYEVTGVLGSGGMGYVISARHAELGEMVALKFLRPEALVHPELVERFAREARAAAKIRSEHVANVFDVGTLPDGTPFIVMEYLAGKDLADHLHHEGPLPISVAVEYIMQACEALAAAHSHGIVHRDIKPENLFLTRQAQGMNIIKVLDFGISKIALPRGKRDLVRTQMALGSPVYMSPEQIRRSDQVDARSDIWAIGCVLFELLTGVTAFDEPSLLELSAAILEREPVPLQTLRPDASEELETLVLKCLSKNPDDRYQNVAELTIALFPFAPRRARISAERCYHMLRNSGVITTELELSSVHPPAMESGRVTAPSARQRTTTPAAVDLVVDDDDALTKARRKGGKLPIFVAFGVLAAAAGVLAFQLRTDARAPAGAAAPQRGAELAAAPAPAAAAKPFSVVDLDLEPPPTASAQQAAKGPRTVKARPSAKTQAKGAAARAAPSPPSTAKRPRSGDDDLDPGF
jgi:eukaryotic-like serine/threonine-protein kinase